MPPSSLRASRGHHPLQLPQPFESDVASAGQTDDGATIGTAQEQTSNATDRLKVQVDLITKQVTTMEQVDPSEASVRVTSLRNQLDMSLALTTRIQKLSILNYL